MVEKTRYFTFLVYPESASSDWLKVLEKSLGAFAISPLHEPDDEVTKPHYHVIYCHGNTVSLEGARKAIPTSVPVNGYIEPVAHPRQLQRYLIHLDQPDKEQFEHGQDEITTMNCFPLDLTREFTKGEMADMKRQCFEICDNYNLVEYCDLLDYLRSANFDLFDYASNHTVMFNGYLTSKRNKFKEEFRSEIRESEIEG